MLNLSTSRQHLDSGFSSAFSLIDELEQQVESLILAHRSPRHIQHLRQTFAHQKYEIRRLAETIENKIKETLKLDESRLHFQNDLQLRLNDKSAHFRRRIRQTGRQRSGTSKFHSAAGPRD